MTNTIVLGFIIAFFAMFAIGLFSVHVYVALGERDGARRKSVAKPANQNRLAA